jgi:hypothetical protein
MAKKKKFKFKSHKLRNATPRSAPRQQTSAAPKQQPSETPLQRLGYTAAGAAGTALAGSFLAHEGWAPKTIATALTAIGAGLAWKGDETTVRSVGAGVMSAAGSQLALMVIDDRDRKQQAQAQAAQSAQATDTKKPSNAGALPPGSIESAFNQARAQLAYVGGDDA